MYQEPMKCPKAASLFMDQRTRRMGILPTEVYLAFSAWCKHRGANVTGVHGKL